MTSYYEFQKYQVDDFAAIVSKLGRVVALTPRT